MTTEVTIPDPIFELIDQAATSRNISRSEVLSEAAAYYFKQMSRKARWEAEANEDADVVLSRLARQTTAAAGENLRKREP